MEFDEKAWDGLCVWVDAALLAGSGEMDVELDNSLSNSSSSSSSNSDGSSFAAQLAEDPDAGAIFYSYLLQRVQEVTISTKFSDIRAFLRFSKNVKAICGAVAPGYDEVEVNSLLAALIYKTPALCADMKAQVNTFFRSSITSFVSQSPGVSTSTSTSQADTAVFIAEFQDPLGLISLSEPLLRALLSEHIDSFIHTELRKAQTLSEHHNAFTRTQEWLGQKVIAWVNSVFPSASVVAGIPELNARLRRHTSAHTYDVFAGVWVPLAYDLSLAYPATEDALCDLRTCLEHSPHLYSELRLALLRSARGRLLTVGASTSSIILAFIKLVKAVKLVDPTGIILTSVAAPIRDYLRHRQDAVQCVVDAFVHKTSSEIEDAFRQKPQTAAAAAATAASSPFDWSPDPVSPDPTFSLARMAAQAAPSTADNGSSNNSIDTVQTVSETHTSDIIELLEEIWGGPEAFTSRYVVALAESLLAKPDHTTEAAQVELLKQRFGDYLMQGCDIMLRDVMQGEDEASGPSTPTQRRRGGPNFYLPVLKKQQQQHQQQQTTTTTTQRIGARRFSADVLSHLYWPEGMLDKDASVVKHFPPSVCRDMARYAKTDPKRFLCKKIVWTGDLGYVDLDIRAPGARSARKFTVPPVYATVIHEFAKQSTLSVADVAERLEVSQESARKCLAFWAKNNVLHPCGEDAYKVLCGTTQDREVGGTDTAAASPLLPSSSSFSHTSMSFFAGRGLDSLNSTIMNKTGSSERSGGNTNDDDDDDEGMTEAALLIQSLVMSTPGGLTEEEICTCVKEELGEDSITNPIIYANLEFLVVSGAIIKDGERYKVRQQ